MQHLLNKQATIQRKTATQSNIGELIESFSNVATYQTRYAPQSGASVNIINNYQKTTTDFLFFFETSADVRLEDRILVDGKVFEIKGSNTFDGYSNAHHIEVVATLIEFA